jgi:hypothetical protein
LTVPLLDPTPWVGNVDPFLAKSSSQFRTAGPFALTSAAYATEFNEVKRLGRIDSTFRTPVQTQKAIFWQSAGGPALLWNPWHSSSWDVRDWTCRDRRSCSP